MIDEADGGINPLGVAQNAVPFGLSSADAAGFEGRTHFLEVYDRALIAAQNAVVALENADHLENRLREVTAATDEARRAAQDQDRSFRRSRSSARLTMG